MGTIPGTINGVTVEFGDRVKTDVSDDVVEGLKFVISETVAPGHTLSKIYVSSAHDQHKLPSRHAQGKAVDISRINGVKIVLSYESNAATKAIVQAIQTKFEDFSKRRENFGPYLKKKGGKAHTVGGHRDHIHLSVD